MGNRNFNPAGIYNNRGRIEGSQRLSDDVWDSNQEKLPDNNNPVYLSRPKSVKQLLNESPAHLRYTGKLTSSGIAEKWAATGEITLQEQHYLSIVNAPLYIKARDQAQIPKLAKKIDQALLENGITINMDEEFTISVDRNNQITVSGIDDPERSKAIQAALQSQVYKFTYSTSNFASAIRGAYFCNSQNVDHFSFIACHHDGQ